jgi:hypothetical protein
MLIEAKGQVAYGRWGRWLAQNFALSQQSANVYMRWARNEADFERGTSKVRHA